MKAEAFIQFYQLLPHPEGGITEKLTAHKKQFHSRAYLADLPVREVSQPVFSFC